MPQAKRKKGDEPDFKKAKLKLGKGKKVPTNATNTSFKARSIALPGQQPLERAAAQHDPSSNFASTPEGAEPLTSSGLNLDEILIRLRHPNAGVRRDGLGGVKEILRIRNGGEVGKVMRALGGIISDEDASVRKALLSLLDWYFTVTPETSLAPHLPLFLLLTSSALSHIFSDIRLDAARLVSLLLQHVPGHITAGWPTSSTSTSGAEGSTTTSGSTILEGLRLALGLGGENASSAQGRLTAGGKLIFLKAVLGFVGQALGGGEGEGGKSMWDGWLDEDGRKEREAETVDIGVHGLAFDGTSEGWVVGSSGWAMGTAALPGWELGRLEGGSGNHVESGDDTSSVTNLFTQLLPLLLSTFLESAPSAFSPSSTSSSATSASTETHIDLCVVTTSLTAVLAKYVITSSTSEKDTGIVRARISDFLKRLSTYFPFTSPIVSSSSSGLGAGLELNLSYARLAALLAPQPSPLVFVRDEDKRRQKESAWKVRVRAVEAAWAGMRAETEKRKAKGKGKAVEGWAMEEVAAWVADLLDISTPPISPSTLSALLPIIWTLITQPPPPASPTSDSIGNIPETVGTALLSFLSRQSAHSTLRAIGDDFIIRLIQVHEQPYPTLPFFVPANSDLRSKLRGWIEGVPKALWELGAKDERGTERLLGFLMDIGMRGSGGDAAYSLLDGKIYPGIAARLGPFFHLSHPTRGPTMGPWTKLQDPKVRRLGLDVARVWSEWDAEGRLEEAVRAAQPGV